MKGKAIRTYLMLLALAVIWGASAMSGNASGVFIEPDVQVLHILEGENVGDYFGWVAADLGDMNGDGFHEVAIPAIFNSDAGIIAGKVNIYSGADFHILNTVYGKPWELWGFSVSSAGDVNNDGVLDYAISGRSGINPTVPGRAAVYSGANHSVLHEWTAPSGEFFGASIAGAGDANGDGYADILVGAPFASHTLFHAGRITLFSGFDGSVLWVMDGQFENGSLGAGLGQVGLLDGDLAPDLVASAPGAGLSNGGEVYVLAGSDGQVLFTLTPFAPGTAQQFGRFFASGAGDVNSDSVPDIFVGDYNDKRGGGVGTGRVYIFSGADGSLLHLFNAQEKGEGFGPGRGTGDVNGDGYGDVIIGAYTNSEYAVNAGKAYLFSGKDGSILRTMTSQVPSGYLGVDALPVGDLNGDGRIDFAVTGVNFGGTGLDQTYIIAGNEH